MRVNNEASVIVKKNIGELVQALKEHAQTAQNFQTVIPEHPKRINLGNQEYLYTKATYFPQAIVYNILPKPSSYYTKMEIKVSKKGGLISINTNDIRGGVQETFGRAQKMLINGKNYLIKSMHLSENAKYIVYENSTKNEKLSLLVKGNYTDETRTFKKPTEFCLKGRKFLVKEIETFGNGDYKLTFPNGDVYNSSKLLGISYNYKKPKLTSVQIPTIDGAKNKHFNVIYKHKTGNIVSYQAVSSNSNIHIVNDKNGLSTLKISYKKPVTIKIQGKEIPNVKEYHQSYNRKENKIWYVVKDNKNVEQKYTEFKDGRLEYNLI